MIISNPFKKLIQKMAEDSASWGSLAMLAIALGTLVVLMLIFSGNVQLSDLPAF